MKVSVAVCTYNGEKYLQEQLNSFTAQTRLPDEVVVCDDCSQDSTREILTAFAESAPFSVKLYFNEQNLGFIKNFEKAIRNCTGEIIVLSDQDDVWSEKKLELIEAEFTKSERIGMVYADAKVVTESLAPLKMTMWQYRGFNAEKQKLFSDGKAFDLLLTDGYVYGSSMAFRAVYRDLFLPIPENTFFIHDNWIALMISSVAEISLIKECIIKYRQHERQSVGISIGEESKFEALVKSGQRVNEYGGTINQLNIAEKRLKESDYSVEEKIQKIKTAREHISARADFPKNFMSRLVKVGQELKAGHYHRYSNGFRSALKDLLTNPVK